MNSETLPVEPGSRKGSPSHSICSLETIDRDWLSWIKANPSANIFHHPAWMELLATCYGYRPFLLTVRDQSGQILAGLPVMEVKGFTSRRWVALPFTDHLSPLSDDRTALDDLYRCLISQYQQERLAKLEVRWELPRLPAAQSSEQHVLHQLYLEADTNRVHNRFHSMHQRNIKTAENNGVRIEQGYSEQQLREFYRLHLMTRQRQGMPTQPWRFFQLLGKLLLERDLGFLVLAYKEDECIAASVFLKWQKTLMYKFGASTHASLKYRPNNLVMWTAIRWGCENDFTIFDLGRTDNENTGLRNYKSGWGAQEIPLSYTILSQKPPVEHIGHLMHLMRRAIRHSPVWVSQLAGQLLYRYFG